MYVFLIFSESSAVQPMVAVLLHGLSSIIRKENESRSGPLGLGTRLRWMGACDNITCAP